MIACGILGGMFGADRAYWLEVQARFPELEDAADLLADQLAELGARPGETPGEPAPGDQGVAG